MYSSLPSAAPVRSYLKHSVTRGWSLPLLCLGLAASSAWAEQPAQNAALPADEIVRRAVLRDDQLRASRTTMKCDRIVRTDRLDANGKVIDTKTVRTVHSGTPQLDYTTDVESSKAQDTTGENTVKAQKIEAVMSLRKLAPRFDMALTGEETVRGQPCYVITYRPKANQPYSATREEKVISNLHGRFWMSKNDFSIIQSEGTLVSPVTVALIASVNQMEFKFHSQSLPNGDTAPGDFTVSMAVKAPFYDFRQHQLTTEENWRPR